MKHNSFHLYTRKVVPQSRFIKPEFAIACYAFVLICCFIWQPSSQIGMRIGDVAVYLILSLVTVVVHIILHNEKNWMRIDTVFLLGYLIVNFQWPSMVLLSKIFPDSTIMLEMVEDYLTYGTWLATLGLASWAIGYAIPGKKCLVKSQFVGNISNAAIIQGVLIAIFIVLVGRDYLLGAQYSEVREDVWGTVQGTAAYVFTIMVVTGVVVMLSALYNYVQLIRIGQKVSGLSFVTSLPMTITFIYILMFLVAGERGQVIQIFVAGAIVLSSTIRPMRLPVFVLLVAVGAMVVSILGYSRAYGYGNIADFFVDSSVWTPTVNLANSAITTYLGIELVDANHGLYWGQLWISQILSLVPFAQSFFIDVTGIPKWELSGAYLITYHVFGSNPHTGYGTSLMIDIFMNFGVFGVIMLMIAYGHICRVCQVFISARNGFYPFLAAGMFASLVFYISRSSLFVQLQPVVWGYLFAVLIFKVRNGGIRTGS